MPRKRVKAEEGRGRAEDSEPEGSEVSYDSDKGAGRVQSDAESDEGNHPCSLKLLRLARLNLADNVLL